MKGNRRSSPPAASSTVASVATPAPPPASPLAKGKQKYTNKDGSKFFTVTKSSVVESHPPPLPYDNSPMHSLHSRDIATSPGSDGPAPAINRKKAKRRAKIAAAREKSGPGLTVDMQSNSALNAVAPASQGQWALPSRLDDDAEGSGYEAGGNMPEQHNTAADKNGALRNLSKSKKAKKKKKKKDTIVSAVGADEGGTTTAIASQSSRLGLASSKEKIWNTNSQEERRRIKDFWLDLSEDERKSLVKVEKDTVLRKMKEQQKMTCSCHFCGRKRTAIEEELEGLYDSYYEELEQYAHDPAGRHNPPLMSSNRHFTTSHVSESHIPASAYTGQGPSRGQIVGQLGEYDEEHGEYENDLDDESDHEEEGELRQGGDSPEAFPFGNSLKVHGGILTVADDLLKNDGQKFITMMEQLAESRMAREEDARDRYSSRSGSFVQNGNDGVHNHSHHVASDEDNYSPEEDGDEEYEDSQDEEYEDEEEVMTEAQRMEEGRRMFQIFAARMFEQRVLTAYREKVAKERQQKLLEELADEETQESQRKAKKAKEAQKRKDKAAQKKQALAEEKARKDAEKAAEEAERQAEEALKAEEQRQKAEEKRRKREAQKRLEEEERLRKEAERLRRIHEQKERQAEQERRTRDAKERERKRREEVRLKEKEAQDRKDREIHQRKDKDERGRRDREANAGGDEARSRQRQDERTVRKTVPLPVVPTLPPIPAMPIPAGPSQASSAAPSQMPISLPKRPFQQHQNQALPQQPTGSGAVPVLLQQPSLSMGFASPSLTVATPAVPKVPTPMRARQPSQQGGSTGGSQSGTASRTASLSGSGQSQNASPNPMTPVQASISSFGLAKSSTGASNLSQGTASLNQNLSQAASPLSAPTQQSSPFSMAPSPISMPYPLGITPVALPAGLGLTTQFGPLSGGNYRNCGSPSMMQIPPGINGLGRGFSPMIPPPPGFEHNLPQDQLVAAACAASPFGTDGNGIPVGHSRQPSAGFDAGSSPASTKQPIGRPAPIGRPGSAVHGQHAEYSFPAGASAMSSDADNSYHLGSSALLENSDCALDSFPNRRPVVPVRPTFGVASGSFGVDLASAFIPQSSLWGGVPSHPASNSFASGPSPGFPVGGMASGGWGIPVNPVPFSLQSSLGRSSQARSVTLRQFLCRACKELSGSIDADGDPANPNNTVNDSLIPIDIAKTRVAALARNYLGPIQNSELDILYDTEGNSNNGGGNFEVHRDSGNSVIAIRWIPDLHIQHLSSPAAAAATPPTGSSDGNTTPIGATLSR